MSGKPVAFHPEALAEAEAAIAWYHEKSARAAETFLTELERGFRLLKKPRTVGPSLNRAADAFHLYASHTSYSTERLRDPSRSWPLHTDAAGQDIGVPGKTAGRRAGLAIPKSPPRNFNSTG